MSPVALLLLSEGIGFIKYDERDWCSVVVHIPKFVPGYGAPLPDSTGLGSRVSHASVLGFGESAQFVE